MPFVLRINLEVTDFLKGLTAESFWSGLTFPRQGEVGEVLPFGNAFLEGTLASLLQQGKEMTGRAFMSALVTDVRLEIIDELLCQLPESDVLRLELLQDEGLQIVAESLIVVVGALGTVNADA